MIKQFYSYKKKLLIPFLVLLVTMIWGYAWTLMKEALTFMGPYTFSALRFLSGSLTMLLILFFLKIPNPPKSSYFHLIIVGILQTSIVFLWVMYGLNFVNAGKSSVLLYSMPIWSTLLAFLILKEKTSPFKIFGLAIGLIGLLTILGWDIWLQQSSKVIWGELLIVGSAISWGASNVYYRKYLSHLSQIQVNTFQMIFGTIGLIIVALLMEGGEPIHWTPYSVYLVLFTGIMASAFCFTVWFYLINEMDMATATISTLLVPIFGIFFSWILIGELLSWSVGVGTLLILIGIIISTLHNRAYS